MVLTYTKKTIYNNYTLIYRKIKFHFSNHRLLLLQDCNYELLCFDIQISPGFNFAIQSQGFHYYIFTSQERPALLFLRGTVSFAAIQNKFAFVLRQLFRW